MSLVTQLLSTAWPRLYSTPCMRCVTPWRWKWCWSLGCAWSSAGSAFAPLVTSVRKCTVWRRKRKGVTMWHNVKCVKTALKRRFRFTRKQLIWLEAWAQRSKQRSSWYMRFVPTMRRSRHKRLIEKILYFDFGCFLKLPEKRQHILKDLHSYILILEYENDRPISDRSFCASRIWTVSRYRF